MADEPKLPAQLLSMFYLVLIGLGLAVYVAWGILYNSWNLLEARNLGVYTVTVLLTGFGVLGFLLYGPKAQPAQ